MISLGRYGKTITALVVGAVGWATLVVESAPNAVTSSEWITGVTVLATALGVYTVANATVSEG